MHREHHQWYSPSLGREMEMLVHGHGGARVLAFPTSMGRYHEWQDFGLVGAMREHVENGWIQIFCVDSVDSESWYAKYKHPHDRAVRHEQYDSYLVNEALPFTASRNGNPFVIAAGASFGAYHAMCFAFRHPGIVNRVVGMSGLYDVKTLTDGYSDDAVYFSNPSDFIQNETDWGRLEAMRGMDTILAIGKDDGGRANNERLSASLASRGIPHRLRLWDGWAHDWPYWGDMFRLYVGGQG